MCSTRRDAVSPAPGCPIRIPSDQCLPAAPRGVSSRGHVLRRPQTPRHPPCAFCTVLYSDGFLDMRHSSPDITEWLLVETPNRPAIVSRKNVIRVPSIVKVQAEKALQPSQLRRDSQGVWGDAIGPSGRMSFVATLPHLVGCPTGIVRCDGEGTPASQTGQPLTMEARRRS